MTPLITSILPFLILSIQVGVSGTSVDSSNTQSPSEEFYSRGCQLLNDVPPINVVTDLYQSPLNKAEDSMLVQKTEDVFLAVSTGQDTTLAEVNQRVIHPYGNTAKCLSAAYNADAVKVHLTDCTSDSNPPPNQLWTLTEGTFRIFGNKCLDNINGVMTNGQTLQIHTCYPGSRNQQWSQTGGSIQLSESNKCLDITDGKTNNGNLVQLWECHDGSNQIWSVVPPPPQADKTIRPGKSGRTCLAATFNSRDGAPVTVQPCNPNVYSGQRWTYSGSSISMKGLYAHMCLEVPGGETGNGVKMRTAPCATRKDNPNQRFIVTSSNQIIWEGHNECLDLSGGKLDPGNQIQMWNCSPGHPNQVWNFVSFD